MMLQDLYTGGMCELQAKRFCYVRDSYHAFGACPALAAPDGSVSDDVETDCSDQERAEFVVGDIPEDIVALYGALEELAALRGRVPREWRLLGNVDGDESDERELGEIPE